ncbi:protein ovarian tumor locus-like [Aricia agestis]|uniref:protein ovarian tumor locus-like n=1 Tax=Aricia agestis TaxID=91739 RepID=UPI001C208E15|nr:protein ovarian tumor locus-like [Aricia agestis]
MSSPLRYRMPWKIQKKSSEPDRWLDEMGFFRKHIARDASCLFRAVSENVYSSQRYFHKVRMNTINFMTSKRHLFEGSLICPFENYIKEMSNPTEWGGLLEVTAMSHLFRRDFIIFEATKGSQTKMCNGYGSVIYLFYTPENKHFDAVYTKDHIDNSAYCQSLVYKILYDGVYQMKDLPYAIDKMLHDKAANNSLEFFMSDELERRKKQKDRAKIFIEAPSDNRDKNNNTLALKCKHYTEDIEKDSLLKESLSIFVLNRSLIQLENVCVQCLNINSAKDLLDNGITPFPYKVAKALDPDIYRNIEFDVWSEMRRELRYGARYSDGSTLQVGVKCLCKLTPDQPVAYRCHIQEMLPERGPCLVFIEELGEKKTVLYEQLQPLPVEEIKPWAPPYRYSQAKFLSQMLPQLGNLARKQNSKVRKAKIEEQDKKKLDWKEEKSELYPHYDLVNFETMPVDVKALPLMVDCRPAGAPPHDIAPAPPPPNGAPPENHHAQPGASGDMGGHVVQNTGRATTPAAPPPAYAPAGVPNCAYTCGKSVVWCAPARPPYAPPYAPPPPPPAVNAHAQRSVHPHAADLPMNDLATLRYFYNVGVECVWATYGPPPPAPPPVPHVPPAPYNNAVQLAHDMQQMSLSGSGHEHKHKPDTKPPPPKTAQRPLLGPRFKRNNQDGNQNNNHNNHNKGHNNAQNNKGPNNRYIPRGPDTRPYEDVVVETPMMPVPYLYPPPLYPVPYYPVDDMMMMPYVYEEEYTPYPPYPPPLMPPPQLHPQHHEHK